MNEMTKKRKYMERKKVFRSGIPKLRWVKRGISVLALGLNLWGKHLYNLDPYSFYPNAFQIPTLIVGISLMLSLITFMLQGTFMTANYYMGYRSKLSQGMDWCFLALTPVTSLIGLFRNFDLYILPVTAVVFIVLSNAYSNYKNAKANKKVRQI